MEPKQILINGKFLRIIQGPLPLRNIVARQRFPHTGTNGHGVFTWGNGSKYDGEWNGNKRHGYGVQTWANGTKYVGEWKDDKRHGKGAHAFANGAMYAGEWVDDRMHGSGTFTHHLEDGGGSFEGNFIPLERFGWGVVTISKVLKGDFGDITHLTYSLEHQGKYVRFRYEGHIEL